MKLFMSTPSGDPDDTRVTIIDSIEGHLHLQSVPVTEPNDLESVLQSRGSNVKTRIILVDYRESFSIDRSVVDVLGRAYDIDPLVFQEHFQHGSVWTEESHTREIVHVLPQELIEHFPSQSRTSNCFNLSFSLYDSVSAWIMILGANMDACHSKSPTCMVYVVLQFTGTCLWYVVVIWMRDARVGARLNQRFNPRFNLVVDRDYPESVSLHPRFSQRTKKCPERMYRMATKYVTAITQWDSDAIALADDDSTEYALPLVRTFLEYHQEQARNDWDPRSVDSNYASILVDENETVLNIVDRMGALKKMRLAIKELEFIPKTGMEHPRDEQTRNTHPATKRTLRDIDSSLEVMQDCLAYYDRIRRDQLSKAQLEEAQKSTKTAISVARLTKLAFVFVPLSFLTSFFGMNIKQFGQGSVSLWVFFVTAAGLICLMLTPFIGRIRISKDITLAFFKFLNLSPIAGFWFLAFSTCHATTINQIVLSKEVRFALSKSRGGPPVGISEYGHWRRRLHSQNPNRYQRFWLRKIALIGTYVEMERAKDGWTIGPLDRLLGRYTWWRTGLEPRLTREHNLFNNEALETS